jgi:hypothetical protein
MEMQSNDEVSLQSAQTGKELKDELEDSITAGGRLRYYIVKSENFESKPATKPDSLLGKNAEELQSHIAQLEKQNAELKSKIEASPKARPKGTPIESFTDFSSEVSKIYDDLNEDYNLGDLVPIYRIRRELGDRVSPQQFDEWLKTMRANDKMRLGTKNVSNLSEEELKGSIPAPGDELLYYASKP